MTISGFYEHQKSVAFFWAVQHVQIKSLTFQTNRRKLGPCALEQGTYFETNEERREIIGIHGFSSTGFVASIGVYMLKFQTFKNGERIQ